MRWCVLPIAAIGALWFPSVVAAQTLSRVSVPRAGGEANGHSLQADISVDGRFVAFSSTASNLTPGDSNGRSDIFVLDRQTGNVERISDTMGGGPGDGFGRPRISADGRFVAFMSGAPLVPGDLNGGVDIYVRDRSTGQLSRASVSSTGAEATAPVAPRGWLSSEPDISDDGRFVTFTSYASNLVADDANNACDVNGDQVFTESCPDVFVHDRQTGQTVLVSRESSGLQIVSPSLGFPAISGNGRFVTFGYSRFLMVHDRQTGQVTNHCSDPSGTLVACVVENASFSADGRFLAFSSEWSDLAGDAALTNQIAVKDLQTGTVDRLTLAHGRLGAATFTTSPSISADGRVVAFESGASNLVAGDTNGLTDVFLVDRLSRAISLLSAGIGGAPGNGNSQLAAVSGDGRNVVFTSAASNLVSGDTNTFVDAFLFSAAADADADGLPDDWETRFGLSISSGAGENGPAGDPDGDGRTNVQEYQEGTHPRGLYTRYLAEGALNAFFDVRLALLNTGTTPARALVRFLQPGGATVSRFETLAPGTRRTLTRADLSTLTSPDFSTVVEADQPVVVDRTMSWDGSGYGSHAETGVPGAATSWYLAEGSTSGDFALFYLIQNPNPAATTATVRYLRPSGLAPIERTHALAPNSRTTIPVDAQGPELASTDVSAVISAPLPIIVERAMYISRSSQVFAAGHGSAGVTAPATNWFLAEGATGPFFDLFILIANPNAQPADVTLDYLLSDGRTFAKSHVVPANGRFTVWVDDEAIPAGSATKPLANVAVSTTVTSTNGVPIIVERAMWWPGPETTADFWTEAHNSAGATATGTRWALAEGEVGGPHGAETYVLIANTSAFGGQARVTLYFEDGGSASKDVPLAPRSRTNVAVSSEFPAAAGRRFATLVESLGATPPQIVVERAMYTSPGGVTWAAGTNALATRLP